MFVGSSFKSILIFFALHSKIEEQVRNQINQLLSEFSHSPIVDDSPMESLRAILQTKAEVPIVDQQPNLLKEFIDSLGLEIDDGKFQ